MFFCRWMDAYSSALACIYNGCLGFFSRWFNLSCCRLMSQQVSGAGTGTEQRSVKRNQQRKAVRWSVRSRRTQRRGCPPLCPAPVAKPEGLRFCVRPRRAKRRLSVSLSCAGQPNGGLSVSVSWAGALSGEASASLSWGGA